MNAESPLLRKAHGGFGGRRLETQVKLCAGRLSYPSFAHVAKGTKIEVLRTPYRAPRANAICERFLGSLRRECLDHFLILGERHLRRLVKEYKEYFNHSRPHQGIEQHIPCQLERPEAPPPGGKIASRPVLSGLHHDYFWQAAENAGQGTHQPSGYLH